MLIFLNARWRPRRCCESQSDQPIKFCFRSHPEQAITAASPQSDKSHEYNPELPQNQLCTLAVPDPANHSMPKRWQKRSTPHPVSLSILPQPRFSTREMQTRIDLHRQRRGGEWVLAETPIDLVDTLRSFDHPDNVILVDCLSVWVTNLIIGGHDVATARDGLIAHLAKNISSLIFVASETGLGIVPDNALSRQFRDESGRLNQMVAAVSDDVFFVTAGIAQKIKP